MNPLIVNTLAVIGALTLLACLLVVVLLAPQTYRILREANGGRFPFDKPVWYYRTKKRVRDFWLGYSEDWFGFYLIITIMVALIYHWIF